MLPRSIVSSVPAMRRFRTPLRRSTRKADPVTPVVHDAVLRRDGMCVQAKLDGQHECRDRWGTPHPPTALGRMTLDHIRLAPGGERKSVPEQLVTLCWSSHLYSGWATAHRPELRAYLAEQAALEANPHLAHVDPCSPTCRREAAA